MSRRSPGLPPPCLRISWWGYVLLAIAGYAFLKYSAPDLAAAAGYAAFGGFLALLAPIITIGFLLLAAARLYDRDDRDQVAPPGSGQSRGGRSDEDDADQDLSGRQ